MSEVFRQVKRAINQALRSGVTFQRIAEEAGVSKQTLNLWMDGKIREPRVNSLIKVARVLDKRIELADGVYQMVSAPPSQRMAVWLRQQE